MGKVIIELDGAGHATLLCAPEGVVVEIWDYDLEPYLENGMEESEFMTDSRGIQYRECEPDTYLPGHGPKL